MRWAKRTALDITVGEEGETRDMAGRKPTATPILSRSAPEWIRLETVDWWSQQKLDPFPFLGFAEVYPCMYIGMEDAPGAVHDRGKRPDPSKAVEDPVS